MSYHISIKMIIRSVAVLLLIIISAAIVILVNHKHHSSPRQFSAENQKLLAIINTVDSNYWKNPNYYLSLANTAIKIAQKSKDSTNLAKAFQKKALCLRMIGKDDSVIYYLMKSLKTSENLHNDLLTVKIKNGIANYYLGTEDYYKAITYFTEALKKSENIQDKHVVGLIYNGLGIVNISLKEYDKAIRYFEQAKALCRQSGDIHNESGIDLNIANCYFEKKDYLKARNCYHNILQTFLRLKDSSQIVLAFVNLSNIGKNMKNTKEAFYYMSRAMEYLKYYNNRSLLSFAYLELGSLYYDSGKYPLAKKYLELSLKNSVGSESKSNSMQALQNLSMIEEKEGNCSLSLKYFKRYASIKDSIMNDETHKKIADIQWKYDLHKKDYENELLQKKYEIKKRQNTIITLASTSIILLILMLGWLIILTNRNLKKSVQLKELDNNILQERIRADEKISALEKNRYQTEIESKNKEMTTTSLQLAAKNEILSDILNSLDKINDAKSIDKESYKELRKTIEKNLNLDNDWNQFKEMFDRIHHDFFVSIKQRCPKLSETELRFCAYLRINLQNKEIAKMLNITTETVKTTRYRIRKKLDLDNKTNLDDFIRNI